jgi:hypothetical protein
MTAQQYQAPASVSRLQTRALIVGVIGLIVCAVGWFIAPAKFFESYLIAFLTVLGLSLGSLGLIMLQHLTGGHWGIIIRRPLEAASRALWIVLIFFVPILFGMKYLYFAWLRAPKTGEGALSPFAQVYLTRDGFYIRAAIYFVVWLLLMLLFNAWSRRQDADKTNEAVRRRMKSLAGPGIILYVFAMTFASVDWVMSLAAHWASTIYGFLFVAGQVISAMALMIVVVVMISHTEPFSRIIQKRHLHDLGKLLFAFILLWAYFDFSQLLIIWSGNLPEEISYYRSRLYGGWGAIALIVLVLHFFVPFFLLLSRDLKRNHKWLTGVALWMIFMRCVDMFWMTRPDFPGATALPTIWDFATLLALGGLWVWFFAWQLKRQPLLPLGEPNLAEAIAHDEH